MTTRFSAKQKNQDHMDLLLSYPIFQKAASEIREEFEIPARTFAIGSKEAEAWTLKLGGVSGRAFAKAIQKLVDEYLLPQNYFDHLKRHILYGTTDAPLNNFAIVPFSRGENPDGPENLTVHVYAHLTKDEYAELRTELDCMGKELPAFSPLKDVRTRIEREKQALDVRDMNENRLNDGDARMSYGEALGDKRGKRKEGEKAREDLRGLDEHRTKRFGKK